MTRNEVNRGRLINFLTGINGVQAGGQATVNMDIGKRYHRNILGTKMINFTGGVAMAVVNITGVGTGGTVTPTIANGVITSVAVVAGGTGYVTGDTMTINDATGVGFVGTITAGAGAITAIAVTSAGVASAASPRSVLSSVRQFVNGVNMRDISPENILKIAFANGLFPKRGQLSLFYTTPWRDHLARNDTTAWDLFGQNTFQLFLGLNQSIQLPDVSGTMEFDNFRNTKNDGKGNNVTFLEPTAQHQFTWPIVAGRNDITTIPFNYPISRLWFQGSNPGNISQVEIYQDRNKVLEATTEQLLSDYQDYGFQFGQPNFINQNWATDDAVKAEYEEPIYFDAAYISDVDNRWSKRLLVGSSLIIRIYSDVPQSITIVSESMPGGYLG